MCRYTLFLLAVAIMLTLTAIHRGDETPTESQPVDEGDVSAPGEELVNDRPAFLVNVEVDRPDGRYRGGDTLSVSFQLERDAHAWLLYHQADGSTVLLFPNQAHPSNRLKAKQKVTLPADRQSYRFRVMEPFGEEALQVIAAVEPIAELAALDTTQGVATPVSEKTLKALAERIRNDGHQVAEHRVRLHTREGHTPLPARRPAKRAALCFGPSKYKNSDQISAFPRYRNAPLLMRDLFVTHGGIATDDVRVLIDEQSTRANFKQAVTQWLPSITEPGDTVFIFFHGHGAPVKNLDGSEADGFDELLTTYDFDRFAVQGDEIASLHKTNIVDDALARWLQELPGRQIVLVIDTCYGGGLVDSVQQSIASFGHDEVQRVGDVTALNTVVLSAGLADEITFSPQGNSYLALALKELAMSADQPVTVRDAFRFFVAQIKKIQGPTSHVAVRFAQEPIMTHNALLDIVLFGKNP